MVWFAWSSAFFVAREAANLFFRLDFEGPMRDVAQALAAAAEGVARSASSEGSPNRAGCRGRGPSPGRVLPGAAPLGFGWGPVLPDE
jgi:hypothetical protein